MNDKNMHHLKYTCTISLLQFAVNFTGAHELSLISFQMTPQAHVRENDETTQQPLENPASMNSTLFVKNFG